MGLLKTYLRQLYAQLGSDGRWALGLGSGFLSMVAIMRYKYGEAINFSGNTADLQNFSLTYFIRFIFGRSRSRFTGLLMEKPIGPSWRPFLYPLLGTMWGCDLNECRYPLDSYKCVGHLFARTLKHGCREVKDISEHSLVSPVDATVVTVGDVTGSRIEQVKGTTYNVDAFVGSTVSTTKQGQSPLKYAVLYLSPDKYHHFHSPCDFRIAVRKHFSGEVLPVFSSFLSYFNDVFSINERVVYSGQWEGGKMYFGAVAAYNVGNIRLSHEKMFKTNNHRTQLCYLGGDTDSEWLASADKAIDVTRGEHLGEFRLGSTVVLIFEAPAEFRWTVSAGDSIKVGERLGGVHPAVRPPSPMYIGYSPDLSCLESTEPSPDVVGPPVSVDGIDAAAVASSD